MPQHDDDDAPALKIVDKRAVVMDEETQEDVVVEDGFIDLTPAPEHTLLQRMQLRKLLDGANDVRSVFPCEEDPNVALASVFIAAVSMSVNGGHDKAAYLQMASTTWNDVVHRVKGAEH